MPVGKMAAKIAREAAKRAKKAAPSKKGMAEAARKAGVLAGGALSLGTVGAGGLMMHVGLSKAERMARARVGRKNVSTPQERLVKQARLRKARSAELKAREARGQRNRFKNSVVRKATRAAPKRRPSSTRAPRRK